MTVLPPDDDRPEPPEPGGHPIPWPPNDRRQTESHRRLRACGESPAVHFLDACRLMEEGEFLATTHLVAYSLRDLEGGIRGVLYSMLDDEQRERVAAAGDAKHQAQIEEMCTLLGFGADDEVRAGWWSFAGSPRSVVARLASNVGVNYLTMSFSYFFAFVMLALAAPVVFGRVRLQ